MHHLKAPEGERHEGKQLTTAPLRGTILDRTYGTLKNIDISQFLRTKLVIFTTVPRNTICEGTERFEDMKKTGGWVPQRNLYWLARRQRIQEITKNSYEWTRSSWRTETPGCQKESRCDRTFPPPSKWGGGETIVGTKRKKTRDRRARGRKVIQP